MQKKLSTSVGSYQNVKDCAKDITLQRLKKRGNNYNVAFADFVRNWSVEKANSANGLRMTAARIGIAHKTYIMS